MHECQRKVAEELSKEIKAFDQSRDIPLPVGIIIGVFSVATAAISVLASFSLFALGAFRSNVDLMWLSCCPFLFPVITGIATTYRRQLSNVGVHICLILATMVVGCVGFGYSIDPVYGRMDNCSTVTRENYSGNDCRKESIVMMYLVAGGVTIGLNVCGLVTAMVACGIALRRRAIRLKESQNEEMQKLASALGEKKHSPIYKGDKHEQSSSNKSKQEDAQHLIVSHNL